MQYRGYKTYKDWEVGNSYDEVNCITNYERGINNAKQYQSLENYYRVDIYNDGILLGSIIKGVLLKSVSEYFAKQQLLEVMRVMFDKSVNIVTLEVIPNFKKGTFCVNIIDSDTFSKVESLKLKDEEISVISEGLHILNDLVSNSVEKIILQKMYNTHFLLYKEREVQF